MSKFINPYAELGIIPSRFSVRAVSESGPFSPDDISGLALWLDASDATTLTLDGDDVTTWADKSSAGNDVTQSAADKKPHATGVINGLAAITFDGVDDILVNSVAGGTFSGTSGHFFIVSQSNSDSNIHNIFVSADEASEWNNLMLKTRISNSSPTMGYTTKVSYQNDTLVGETTINTSANVFIFSSDGNTISMRVNGEDVNVSVLAGSNEGDWFGDISSRDNFSIGALKYFYTEIQNFNGNIGEILYYDGVSLSSSQIESIETYLMNKWGI